MSRRTGTISLKQCFKRLLLVELALFALMAAGCVLLGQMVYRTQVREETENLFRVAFTNLENALDSLDRMALNLVNDRQVQSALLALSGEEPGVVLLDDLYYKLISSSMLGQGQSISVVDARGEEYSSASTTLQLSDGEIEHLRALLRQREQFSSPVWYCRQRTGELVYAREIHSTPYKADAEPIGIVVIQADLRSTVAGTLYEELQNGDLAMTYQGQVVFQLQPEQTDARTLSRMMAQQGGADRVELRQNSRFEGVEFYGFQRYPWLGKPLQAIIVTMLLSLAGIFGIALTLTLRLVHRITVPLEKLSWRMEHVDPEDPAAAGQRQPSGLDELDRLEERFDSMVDRIQDLVRNNYVRRLKEKEYQLRALQSQINPHFLYNTLDSINWLAAGSGQPEISRMVQALAVLFRETPRQQEHLIRLEQELELLNSYITIQKIRLEDRIQVRIEVPDRCLDCLIPKLSLQPIVENAIHYGAECSLEPCRILVRARLSERGLVVYVADDGPGISLAQRKKLKERTLVTGSTSIGLINIQDRIRMLCGPGSDLKIRSRLGYGTLVKLILHQRRDEDV